MIRFYIIVLLFIFIFSDGIFALEFTAEFQYNFDKQNVPADIVIESFKEKKFGIYDAYDGSYSIYKGNSLLKKIKNESLSGGNCFIKKNDKYLFCDSNRMQLSILSADLNLVKTIKPSVGNKFDPTDVILVEDSYYITDNDNHKIFIYKDNETKYYGHFGYGKLEFWYPYGLAVDSEKNIFVTEVLGTRIHKIKYPFEFVSILSGWGINKGELYRPTGIALYRDKYLFVADGYTGLIHIFKKNGEFVDVMKDSSNNVIKFGSPTHIRIEGDLIGVVDPWYKVVKIYSIKGLD